MDYFFANTYMRKVGPKGLGKVKPQIYSTFATQAMQVLLCSDPFIGLHRTQHVNQNSINYKKPQSQTFTKSEDFLLVLILYSLVILGYT